MRNRKSLWIVALSALLASPVPAQVRTVDPNAAANGPPSQPVPNPPTPPYQGQYVDPGPQQGGPPPPPPPPARAPERNAGDTYHRDDLIAGAEGLFGKGAEGLAGLIERILHEQGEPNAYIAGREAAGAIAVGLRYGSGTLFHKVEGQRPIYWTGPSIGFDGGGDLDKVFILVYNLYDTQDIYKRFPAAEGRLYVVGGFAATYLRRGKIVLIPIRLGVGWRAGVNIGYLKFTKKSRWFPF